MEQILVRLLQSVLAVAICGCGSTSNYLCDQPTCDTPVCSQGCRTERHHYSAPPESSVVPEISPHVDTWDDAANVIEGVHMDTVIEQAPMPIDAVMEEVHMPIDAVTEQVTGTP